MGAEKRSLKRIQTKYSVELEAAVVINSKSYVATVLDFNALGAHLKLADELSEPDASAAYLEAIEIKYGQEIVCSVASPRIVRYQAENKTLIVSLHETKSTYQSDRSNRVKIIQALQGLLWGPDPMSEGHLLYFKLSELSDSGFRISSSKSNGHLTPGLHFHDFTLQIPGFENQKVSFVLSNVKEQENQLSFGCRITKKTRKYDRMFSKLKVVSAPLPFEKTDTGVLRSEIKKTKRFFEHMRLTTVRTDDEYQEVLKLRYKAYKAAQKTTDQQTVADMGDEYDEHSIIMTAYIGRNLVGTIRVVMKEPGRTLPCEKYFDLSRFKNLDLLSASEISRFAIDPLFQGTDIFIAISRKLIIELTAKKMKCALCLATQKLAPQYLALGAVQISAPIPHPTIMNETLTLYWIVPERLYTARTSSLGWLFVVGPSLRVLKRFGILKTSSRGWHHYLFVVWELMKLKLFRKKK